MAIGVGLGPVSGIARVPLSKHTLHTYIYSI